MLPCSRNHFNWFLMQFNLKGFFCIDLKYINIVFRWKHLKQKLIKIKYNFGAATSKRLKAANYWHKELRLTCCKGSRSPPVINRIVSCVSPTVLTVQRKVVSNIFFKNRLRQSLTKLNFLTKIIKIFDIYYFGGIFANTYQNVNWPVNIFVIISWSQVKYCLLHDFASE